MVFKPERQSTKCQYVMYIIGDNYSSKDEFLAFMLGQRYQQETSDAENHSLNVYYSHILGMDKIIEIYDFSTDRFIRKFLDIYFDILPKPNLIIYCADLDASSKQMQEWIQLIEDQEMSMAFVSGIKGYSERKQLFNKLSGFFKKDILDYIYFPNLDENSLYTCACNSNKGMSLKNYIRKVNTWASLGTFFKRIGTFLKRKPQSIV